MDNYAPQDVYKNLLKMMAYRNITILSKEQTMEEIAQELNHREYIIITGVRDEDNLRLPADINVILLAPGSKYSKKNSEFEKLLLTIVQKRKDKRLELIFVSDNSLTIYIKKLIKKFRTNNVNISIEEYNYEIFLIELPKHESVPLHVIAAEEEVNSFCERFYTSRDKLPKILQSDPQAVWIGLLPGRCVKVFRISETAGISIVYRYCVKG